MQTNVYCNSDGGQRMPRAVWATSEGSLRRRESDHARSDANLAEGQPALLALIDELAYGLIVVNSGRLVTHINRAARAVLGRAQCLRVTGRALGAWFDRDAIPFSNAMTKAFQGKRTIMKLGDAKGGIMLVPLQTNSGITVNGIRAPEIGHIALLFERSSCSESLSIAFFAQSHGLTNGEERVLRALNDNQSVGEAATSLCTAASTVRTHLNHIREKTGSRSLRALVASVKSMPPLMPAFDG